MNEKYQRLKLDIEQLSASFHGKDESPIDEIVSILDSVSFVESYSLIKGLSPQIKHHWKLFPYLFIFEQADNIAKLIALVGDEKKPSKEILSIISKSLKRASQGGRIELSKHLPDWIKRQTSIIYFLSDTEIKLTYLDNLISEFTNSNNSKIERTLDQIATLLAEARQSEKSLLVAKLPEMVREHQKIYFFLPLEEKMQILISKLKNENIQDCETIIQQLADILSKSNQVECLHYLEKMPNWVREHDLIFYFNKIEDKINNLLSDFSVIPDNPNIVAPSAHFRYFINTQVSSQLGISQLNKEQLQKWLKVEYGKWRLEQQRKEHEKLRLKAEHEEKKRKFEAERQKRARRLEQERLRLEAEHREKERRLEEERQERVSREEEKQVLLRNLRKQFEENFLNAHNFYQANCTKHISFDEYQSEKINYVQSWVQRHLNSEPDHEQAAAIGACSWSCASGGAGW